MKTSLLSFLQRTGSFFANPRLIALAQPERLFLSLAIPFGIIFIFLSAPFQAPDEHNHFYRVYSISLGHFSGINMVVPQSVLDFSKTVSKDLPGNDQNKQSKKALVYEFTRPFEAQPLTEVPAINTAIVSPLPYLPQSIGVLIGRLLHVNPIFIFYLGRFTNFLAWLGLTYLAIRITPIHKRLFTALALMPMTLHQAASNSPDAATIALSFLLIAYALRILMDQRPKIDWTDWGKIGLLVIAVALCKSIYVLAAGLLLAVPFRRSKQQPLTLPATLTVIGVGLLAGFAWLSYSSQIVSEEMMNTFRTPTTSGIWYILQHPQVAAPVLWRSAVTYTGDQMIMFIGNLGWFDTVLPGWVYPLYYAMLLSVVILEPHAQVWFYLQERLWMAVLALTTSFIMLALFFYPEASVGNGIVDIVQGRYYIPLGAFYFLPFSQRKWSLPQNSRFWVFVALLHALVLLVAIRAMLWRYYAI